MTTIKEGPRSQTKGPRHFNHSGARKFIISLLCREYYQECIVEVLCHTGDASSDECSNDEAADDVNGDDDDMDADIDSSDSDTEAVSQQQDSAMIEQNTRCWFEYETYHYRH